jgi:hypothetical protein
MPTPTYTALATVTLGSSAASVTFSSIPATYRDLVIVFIGQVNAPGGDFVHAFNGDTNYANYSRVYAFGDGSSATSANQTSAPYFWYAITGSNAINTLEVMDYSATDKHKTVLARYRQAGTGSSMVAGRWANTAAITSITTTQSCAAGSTFSLYGIAS